MKPSTTNLGQFLVDLMIKRIAFNLRLGNWDKFTATFTRMQLRNLCKVSRIEDATIERMVDVIEKAGFSVYGKSGTYVVSFEPRLVFNSSNSLSELITGNEIASRIDEILTEMTFTAQAYPLSQAVNENSTQSDS